jgi:tyrosine-protein kinase Etk/Wzc
MNFRRLLDPQKLSAPLRTREVKRVVACAAAGWALALLYAVLTPNWYRSTLTVVPAGSARGAAGSQFAGLLGGGVMDLPDLGTNADVERISAVFESQSVTDAVVRKFNLMSRYNLRYIEPTRNKLWSLCSTTIDRKARLVSLSCEDKDPHFVQAMLQYFGEYGNEVFRRVTTSSATEEVRFLQRRVGEMRKETDESARRIREFEEKYKIIDLESQSRAVVSAMASLRSQEISKELQLSYMNTFSARDESSAMQLRQQLSVMGSKFKTLEEEATMDGPATAGAKPDPRASTVTGTDMFPPAMSVPRLRFDLEQLTRDRKIREADLQLLMQRLEMARVNEARDTSAFQILDEPYLPTYKSRPQRLPILLMGSILGMVVGLFWVLGPSYMNLLRGPVSERASGQTGIMR